MGACASVQDANCDEGDGEATTKTRSASKSPQYLEVLVHNEVVAGVPETEPFPPGPYARLCNGSRGCDIPNPSERAITLRQLQHVFACAYAACREEKWTSTDPRLAGSALTIQTVTLRDIVENFVKPATAGGNRSLVEMIGSGAQKPMWFVSHWWGEPMHDLLSSLEQHAHDHGTSDDTTYWVSAFAARQSREEVEAERACESVRDTQRFKAMQFSEGLVNVLDRDAIALTRARVVFELYTALTELPPDFKIDVYTTTALDPDQPLQRPGHASPAVWLKAKPSSGEQLTWQPLRLAVGLVDGLQADVRLLGPLIATAAKARRERGFPMTHHARARVLSVRHAGATSAEDLAWIRKLLHGREAEVDATLRARLGAPTLPSLLASRELSAEPLLKRYLSNLARARLRRLAVACVDRPTAERCAQLGAALPPVLEELSLHHVHGGALIPRLCALLHGDHAEANSGRGPLPPILTTGTSANALTARAGAGENGLTRLTMRSCALVDAHGVALAEALTRNATLRVLILRDTSFTDSAASALARALRTHSALETLKLPRSAIGDVGASAFGGALEVNASLATLSLNSTRVGDGGATALAHGLAANRTLRTLNLRKNAIGDAGAVAIGDALARNARSALRELDLGSCHVGDVGARALARALGARREPGLGLTVLTLIKNQLGDSGAYALADGLRAHADSADTIRELAVFNQASPLSADARAALDAAWHHGARAAATLPAPASKPAGSTRNSRAVLSGAKSAPRLLLDNPVITPSVIKIVGRPPRRKLRPPHFNHV